MDSSRRNLIIGVALTLLIAGVGFAAWKLMPSGPGDQEIAEADSDRPSTMRGRLEFDEDIAAEEGGPFDGFRPDMGMAMRGMGFWGGSDEERRERRQRRREERRAHWESLSPEEREARRERRRARRREHFLERVQISGVADDSELTREQLFEDLDGARQATRDCMRENEDARAWFRQRTPDAGAGGRALSFSVSAGGVIDPATLNVSGAPDAVLQCFQTGFGGATITRPGDQGAEVEIELPTRGRRGRGRRDRDGRSDEGPRPPRGENRPPPPPPGDVPPPPPPQLGADLPPVSSVGD